MLSPKKRLTQWIPAALLVAVAILSPEFILAQCDAGEEFYSYCYTLPEVNTTAFEVCPDDPTATVEAEIIQAGFLHNPPTFVATLTVYEGSIAPGNIVFGPAGTGVAGETLTSTNAGDCLIFVINASNSFGVSCQSGGVNTELQVCASDVGGTAPVTFFAPNDLCETDGVQSGLSGGMPTGGIYSGDGVNDNEDGTYDFNPATAGVGITTITYTVGGNSAMDDVEVFASPMASFIAPADVCIDAGLQTGLSGGSPSGGTYSGPGVTDNGDGTYDFNPGIAGLGVHTISYTIPGICEETAMDDIEVLAACGCPVGQSSFFYCYDNNESNTVAFEVCPTAGQSPKATITAGTIGSFFTMDGDVLHVYSGTSGSGTSGTLVSGPLTGDLSNTVINGPAADECLIFVISSGPIGSCATGNGLPLETGLAVCGENVAPEVNVMALADLCITAGIQTGLSGGNPEGGVYSGPGVSDDGNGMTYSFNPASAGVGVHTITYTFGGEMGTDEVEVFESGVVSLTALADLCVDAGLQQDLTGGTPAGGTYSGTGVTDNGNGTYDFNPGVAGVGIHTLSYTQPGGCEETAMDDVEVTEACGCPSGQLSHYACFGNNQAEGTIFEICPDAGKVGQANIIAGTLGLDDVLTVYQGSTGSGSTILFGPATGTNLSGETITGTAIDECLIFVLSTGPVTSCQDGFEAAIQVCGQSTEPNLAFTAPADVNINTPTLTGQGGGTPTGGVYSGPGVSDDGNGMTYSFNPAGAGVGVHTITYTVNGSMVSDDIEVFDILPSFSSAFSPNDIGPLSSSRLTFTIDNTGSPNPLTGISFTNTLPSGLVIADAPGLETTCSGGALSGPSGGTTLTYTDGELTAGASCTVSINVVSTSASAATITNTSGDLTSERGNSGNTMADIQINVSRPGFYKNFAPGSVTVGQHSRLTLTVDNTLNTNNVQNISFTDPLPVGMVAASPSNFETDCEGFTVGSFSQPATITLSEDGTSLNAFGIFLDAGATCSVSFDIVPELGVETLENVTSALGTQTGSSGFATATLNVNQPGEVFLEKSFSNDPVGPGDQVDLTFTISNFSRDQALTDISFTDDLDATLSGLVAVGLPQSDVCGTGSTFSGTNTLTLTGGNLPSEGSCTFTVTLQVPAGAATGIYPNTTSAITANTSGGAISGAPAQDNLAIKIVPNFTKTFQSTEAVPGSTVDLEFSLTNPSTTETITDISFTDDLAAFLSGAQVISGTGPNLCGTGSFVNFSTSGGNSTLTLTAGNLAPGGNCNFTVTLSIPEGTSGGAYTNTTSLLSSTTNGETTFSAGASDDLTILPAPKITKSFVEGAVLAGETVTLEFTIDYTDEATYNATNISFTDDLDAFLSGTVVSGPLPTNPCGTGSAITGTSNLELTGGELSPGGSCTFQVTIQTPASVLPGVYTNTTSPLNSTINELSASSLAGTDQLIISGLEASLTVLNNPVVAGDLATLEFSFENVSTVDLTNMVFTLSLPSGFAAEGLPESDIVGNGSLINGTTTLILNGGNLTPGTSETFTVNVRVPASADDNQYGLVTSQISSDFDGIATTLSPLNTTLEVQSELIGIEKTFLPNSTVPGGTVEVIYTLTNLSDAYDLENIEFTDDFDAALSGLSIAMLPVAPCGGNATGTSVLNISGASVTAGNSCMFTVTLQVPDPADGGIYTSTSSALTGSTVGDGYTVTGSPATDELTIESINLGKSFPGVSVIAGNSTTLQFTLTNNGATEVSGISFTDDLSAMVSGLTFNGSAQTNICGTGSVLSGSGSTLLSFTGGTLAPGSNCTFSVELDAACDISSDTYTNTTSLVSSNGLSVGEPATADLEIQAENTPPDITCPENITIECDETTMPSNTGMATATDNCTSGLTPDYEDEDMLTNGLGTIERTWSVMDDAGNSDDCVQVITIQDTTDPEFTSFPMDAEVECGASTDPASTGSPVAADNCSTPTPEYEDGAMTDGCGSTGSFERTWTATDNAGNMVMQVQTITIVDNTQPVFTDFPANTTLECGESTDPADTGMPGGTDVCGMVTIDFSDAFAEDCGDTGIITRTWTATDECGNVREQDQLITIEDTTPPSLSCPDDIVETNTAGTCGTVVTFMATANDACSSEVMITYSQDPGTVFAVGETTVTVNATDACNLMADECTFTVTVNDAEDPEITCPDNITIECDESTLPANTGMATATDNCTSGLMPDYEDEDMLTNGLGTIERTWSVMDDTGNSNECMQTITIQDTTDPEFTSFPMDAEVECGQSTDPASTGMPVAADNCSSPMPTYEDGSMTDGCGDTGSFERTWTATDNVGNSVIQVQTITIVDNTAPEFTSFPMDTEVECGQSTDPASTGMPSGDDLCGTIDINYEDSFSGACGNSGVITRTWTITDACGNSDEQDQMITIEDTTPPVLTCPDNITVSNDEGDCGAIVTFAAEANDNCGSVMVNYSTAPGSFFEVGTTIVEVNGADACNNPAMSCTFNVTVNDTEAPVPVCLDTEIIIEPDGTFEVPIEDVIDLSASTDNCELGMAEIETTVITCDESGSVVPVEVNLSDAAGNVASCTAMLLVNTGDALPEPWESADIGESTSGNTYAYNPCGEQFSITSTAQNTTFQTEDDQAYISIELCGDFGMQVRVDSLLGDSGYGGIMIRENNDPGAKQVSVLSNLTNLVRWEHRQNTDGFKQTALYYKPFPVFLRLIRRGNLVRALYSNSGSNFQLISVVEINMNECLKIGLTAFSNDPFGTTRAVFGDVKYRVLNNNTLSQEDREWLEGEVAEQAPTFGISDENIQLYPNPATEQLTLEWQKPVEQPVNLILHNELGQAIETRLLEPGSIQTTWDVSQLATGLYLIEVRAADGQAQLLRFIKTK
jgi:uncharacterized repeat protein (TIGR01451 family)